MSDHRDSDFNDGWQTVGATPDLAAQTRVILGWLAALSPVDQAEAARLLPLAAIAQRDEVKRLVEEAHAARGDAEEFGSWDIANGLAAALRPFAALAEDTERPSTGPRGCPSYGRGVGFCDGEAGHDGGHGRGGYGWFDALAEEPTDGR